MIPPTRRLYFTGDFKVLIYFESLHRSAPPNRQSQILQILKIRVPVSFSPRFFIFFSCFDCLPTQETGNAWRLVRSTFDYRMANKAVRPADGRRHQQRQQRSSKNNGFEDEQTGDNNFRVLLQTNNARANKRGTYERMNKLSPRIQQSRNPAAEEKKSPWFQRRGRCASAPT